MRLIGSLHTLPLSYFVDVKDETIHADAASTGETQNSEHQSVEHLDRCSVGRCCIEEFAEVLCIVLIAFLATGIRLRLRMSHFKQNSLMLFLIPPAILAPVSCILFTSFCEPSCHVILQLHPAEVASKHIYAAVFHSASLLQPLIAWSLEALLSRERTSSQTGIATILSASFTGTHLLMKTALKF